MAIRGVELYVRNEDGELEPVVISNGSEAESWVNLIEGFDFEDPDDLDNWEVFAGGPITHDLDPASGQPTAAMKVHSTGNTIIRYLSAFTLPDRDVVVVQCVGGISPESPDTPFKIRLSSSDWYDIDIISGTLNGEAPKVFSGMAFVPPGSGTWTLYLHLTPSETLDAWFDEIRVITQSVSSGPQP